MSLIKIVQEEVLKYLEEDLDKWFNKEKWVDISRKNKDGSHPPCGASAGKGKRKKNHFKAYPKCRPVAIAAKMSDKEKKNATARKRKAVKKDRNKSTPTNTK